MKNRILLCTSPLQVVNTRSALDYLNGHYDSKDYVIMIHPQLLDSTKEMIRGLSNKLGYKDVFDLTHLSKDLNRGKKRLSLLQKISRKRIGRDFRKKLIVHDETVNAIKVFIDEHIGIVDEIFCRMMYRQLDMIFFKACNSAQKKYGIEDGIGDYLPKYWKYKNLNKHDIKHALKSNFYNYFLHYTSLLITRKFNDSRSIYLKDRISWDRTFTNIRKEGSDHVGDYFLRNIRNLYEEKPIHSKRKIIIIGSIIPDPRYQIDTQRVVEIYNLIIEKIIQKHNVSNDDIWYKPHPRLSYESWDYKKKNLDCNIYDYNNNILCEIELCNSFITAVYSVGSSSFLYAKKLFNLDAYRIDIRNENVHPAKQKKLHSILSSFGIEEIVP